MCKSRLQNLLDAKKSKAAGGAPPSDGDMNIYALAAEIRRIAQRAALRAKKEKEKRLRMYNQDEKRASP